MDPLLGQIQLFPYNFVPQGWLVCAGQLISVQQNAALYSLLGTQYGGDGRTNFGIPNLQGAEPIPGMLYCIAMTGIYPERP